VSADSTAMPHADSLPTCVLVLEDRDDARRWLVQAVESAFPGCRVSATARISEARACIAQHAPGVAIIDLSLPDGSGIEIIELLRARAPACRTVVATVFADDQHLFAALRAGARGYVLKEETNAHLVEQLRAFARGTPMLSPPIADRLVRFFHPEDGTGTAELSGREREVLVLLAKGLSILKVAVMLGISPNTASTYTKGVYRKLGVTTRAEATLEATRRGLVHL
jgi:DNA-binding NarL/FixJ family response regulator